MVDIRPTLCIDCIYWNMVRGCLNDFHPDTCNGRCEQFRELELPK